jgi:hypothetical protein
MTRGGSASKHNLDAKTFVLVKSMVTWFQDCGLSLRHNLLIGNFRSDMDYFRLKVIKAGLVIAQPPSQMRLAGWRSRTMTAYTRCPIIQNLCFTMFPEKRHSDLLRESPLLAIERFVPLCVIGG